MRDREYNDLFDRLDLKPRSKAAADLLGICRRSAFMYSHGDRAIPVPVAKLLRLTVAAHAAGLKVPGMKD
jgi:hypothetical protein